jgi:long-chain acyl-CoA synthetase
MVERAQSIVGAFERTVQTFSDRPAARYREGESWHVRTWGEMDQDRLALASGLLSLGLEPGQRVCILSNSSYRWMVADLAIQSCGAQTVPIYQSNLASEVQYIVSDSGARCIFVEDADQLAKVVGSRAELGQLQHVVVLNDQGADGGFVRSYASLLQAGRAKLADTRVQIQGRSKTLKPEDILTIIYTSGTTGKPKGVVLTHASMLYEAEAVEQVGILAADDLELLFLPMAHVFAKVLQCTWFKLGHEMAIEAEIPRLTKSMGEVRPTVMASVPRIFEKVYDKVVGTGLSTPGVKGVLFRWAMGVLERMIHCRLEGRPVASSDALQLRIAKKLVFKKVRNKLNDTFGGRMRFFVSGGAPLSKAIAYFFDTAGILILEGYGLTETSAATCVNPPHRNKIGTVGPPLPGTEIRIAPDGEIRVRGPGVMKGYWNRPEDTQAVLDGEGWFATGDIGILDVDGHLVITDRKKDIIITAGGKNVAPQNIENMLKTLDPLISQVVVHGDQRKFLSALITIDPEQAEKFARDHGVAGSYGAITQSSPVRKYVEGVVARANQDLAQYETIKKFAILDRDFEVGEELTPTLKVKRKYCNEKYREILDGLYDDDASR